jgi:MFS family permease
MDFRAGSMNPGSYRRLLREQRDYRRLWLGDLASFLGDWFNLIAIYTSVQAITDSRLAIAAVVAAKTLPSFLMVPIAGPIVDRFDRRKLLLASDVARAMCVIGLIVSHHARSLVGLYAFSFAMVTFTGVAFPTKKAAMPMLVPRERIGIANALMGGTWSVMLAFGAALGGLAVQYLGVTASFVIDAATYLVSAAFFWGLPALTPPARATAERTGFADGIRYLRRTPYVLALAGVKPFMCVATSVAVVIPLYGTVVFPLQSGPLYVGILYAVRGAGAAVGSLAVPAIFGQEPRHLRRLIVVGYVLIFLALTLVARAESYWVAALGFFLAAIGSGMNWVLSGTLLQLEADPAFHGRVFSLEFGVTMLVLAGGGLLVGLAQDSLFFWIGTLAVLRHRHAAKGKLASTLHEPPYEPPPG